MKAIVDTGYVCQCRWMLRWLEGKILLCVNPECEHHGKTYRAPVVELEEAETFAPQNVLRDNRDV